MKIACLLFILFAGFVSSAVFARDECRGIVYTEESCRQWVANRDPASTRDPRADSDCDGLSDNEEDINFNCMCDSQETCWDNSDTDQDCIKDGIEVHSGTNPLKRYTD